MDEVVKYSLKIVESLVRRIVPSSINNVEIQSSVMPCGINDSRIEIRIEVSMVDNNLGVATIIKPHDSTLFITEYDRQEYEKRFEKMAMSEIEHILMRLITLINSQDEEYPGFECVKGEEYYSLVTVNQHGCAFHELKRTNNWTENDKDRYFANNYFKSKDRVVEVAMKIKMLLLLERYHDIYCPEYKPDWKNQDEKKYMVYYNHDSNRWYLEFYKFIQRSCVCAYFPTEEIAQKVCDKLNEGGRKP